MKKITKIFASVFALLLVCVGAIGLVGCKNNEEKPSMPNNIAYGQEFTILTNSVKTCEGTNFYGKIFITMDFQVGILNTTNQEYNLNHQALILYWDDNDLTINDKTYLQFSTDSEEYSVILPNTIKNNNWTNGMRFDYTCSGSWTNSTQQRESVKNRLKDVNFTLKYNGIQVASFKMDISNIDFQD